MNHGIKVVAFLALLMAAGVARAQVQLIEPNPNDYCPPTFIGNSAGYYVPLTKAQCEAQAIRDHELGQSWLNMARQTDPDLKRQMVDNYNRILTTPLTAIGLVGTVTGASISTSDKPCSSPDCPISHSVSTPGSTPMSHPRAYTLDEIDRMRAAIAHTEIGRYTFTFGSSGPGPTQEKPTTRDNGPAYLTAAQVEDRLRTYILAGISPDELEAKAKAEEKKQ